MSTSSHWIRRIVVQRQGKTNLNELRCNPYFSFRFMSREYVNVLASTGSPSMGSGGSLATACNKSFKVDNLDEFVELPLQMWLFHRVLDFQR